MLSQSSRVSTGARRCERAGFTLVEVIVSMVILGLLGLGIVASTLQIRRAAEATVREANANAVAIGFLEQLQGMDYTILSQLAAANGEMSFVVRDGTELKIALNSADFTGPLSIPINVDREGEYSSNMDFWLRVSAQRDTGGLPSLHVKLAYRWQDPHSTALRANELTLARARTQN